MALDLLPVRTFGQVLSLASFHGSSFKVFKMRRIQRHLQTGRTAEAKSLAEEIVHTSKLAAQEGVDKLQMNIAAGELLAQLGGLDLAVKDYLLEAAETLADQGDYARARPILEAILEARPTHEAAKRQLSRVRAQLEKQP
jgi:hypothetical protein